MIEQLERDLGQVHEMYGQPTEQDSRENREQIEQLEVEILVKSG